MSKKIYCLLIALLMVLTVSCVSAAEYSNNSTAAVDEQVEVQTAIDDFSLESDDGDANYGSTISQIKNINIPEIIIKDETIDLKIGDEIESGASLNPADGGNLSFASSNESVVTVDGYTGVITAVGIGNAIVKVSYAGNDRYDPAINKSITVTVHDMGWKIPTEIDASAVTAVYNVNNNLVITLKDVKGNPLSGFDLTVDLNGKKTYTTDAGGQVTVSTKVLAPKAYTAIITFNGNIKYDKSTKDVKVTVKKATSKIAAKAKTFKRSTKTKKYTIKLKTGNKAVPNVKVYVTIKGKKYKKTIKATTNAKGQAVFKIKKLTKKGKYKATITFKGNKYYKASKKTVRITIK